MIPRQLSQTSHKGDAMLRDPQCPTRTTQGSMRLTVALRRRHATTHFITSLAIYVILLVAMILIPGGVFAGERGPVARWSFDNATGPIVRDPASGTEDKVQGFYKYVAGVSGNGIRFDGYTTSRPSRARAAPQLRHSFSLEAWVALNVYP